MMVERNDAGIAGAPGPELPVRSHKTTGFSVPGGAGPKMTAISREAGMNRAILMFVAVVGWAISVNAQSLNLLQAAQEAKQRGDCDEAIRQFGAFIASRAVMPKSDLANVYNDRGSCWFEKGETAKAISDYTAAIKLDPKNGDAYNLRGWAHFARTEMSQAIADSTAALRINPNLVFAYRNRGRAQVYSGRPKLAVEDLSKAVQRAPTDAAGVLWLAIARSRAKQEDRKELEDFASKIDRDKWPAPILAVYLGTSTPDELRSKAAAWPDANARREIACDADVYLGLYALATEDKDEASRLFQSATENCPVGAAEANEIAIAKMEAKRLHIAGKSAGRRAKPAADAQPDTGSQ
jgi:lipoprotein NlpI